LKRYLPQLILITIQAPFKSKLEQHGITLPGGSITPAWQKVIYEKLGYPEGVNKDDLE
jgi:hypothetical protein